MGEDAETPTPEVMVHYEGVDLRLIKMRDDALVAAEACTGSDFDKGKLYGAYHSLGEAHEVFINSSLYYHILLLLERPEPTP